MSTADQRKQLKAYYTNFNVMYAEWLAYGDIHQRPKIEPLPDDLKSLRCGAKTRAGTPCKQKAIYINGRCKFHGGLSTGPRTPKGKNRSSMNGFCPKKKRSQTD
ncbi:MAG: HGGxSTG domain-containing protein [Methylovulum sp.]